VLTRFVLIPLALFAALLFRDHTWGLALTLTLGGLLTARLIIAAALAIHPSFPLDRAPVVTGALGQVVAYGCGMAGAIAYVLAATLSQMLGAWGTAVTAVGVLGVGVASIVAQVVAARRLARLEHLG
jgi:hypothetical protein